MDKKALIENKFVNHIDDIILKNVLINAAEDEKFHENGIIFVNSTGSEIKMSYKELFHESLNILGKFQSLGIDKGSYLIFQIENELQFIKIFWACILGGIIPAAATVPTNTSSKKDILKKFCNITSQIDNSYTVIEDKIFNEFKEEYKKIDQQYIMISDVLSYKGEEGKVRSVSCDDTAYIQYSSGSTGVPKGVVLKNRNLIYNIYQISSKIELKDTDISGSWMPLTHDMGLVGFHLVATKAKINQIRMEPNEFIRKPLLFLEKVKEHNVTITCSPNFGLKWMIDKVKDNKLTDIDLSSIRLIFNGAEPISMDVIRTFNEKFKKAGLKENTMYQVYGMAEACLAVTFPKIGSLPKSVVIDRRNTRIGEKVEYTDISQEYASEYAVVGKPLEGMIVKILDDEGNLLNENCIGNVVIKGLNIFDHYFNSNKAEFTKDNFFYTGDLGFITDGELVIVSRKKDIIFVNGKNYYSNDLEEFLSKNSSVSEGKCAVVAVFNNKEGHDDIIVFVKARCGAEKFIETYKEVKKVLFNKMGINVKTVISVKNIPKTTSGKPKRFKLRDKYNKGIYNDTISKLKELINVRIEESKESKYLDNANSKKLLKIVENILKVDKVSLFDDIFELGLDSIKLIYLISEIKKEFNVTLKFTEVINFKNIYELLKFIESRKKITSQYVYPKFAGQKQKWNDKFDLTEVQRAYYLGRGNTFSLGNISTHGYYEFESKLNIEKFNIALNKVIKRQPMLRAVIYKDGKQQVLKEVPEYKIEAEDLRNMSKSIVREKIEKERDRMAECVFDIEKWPLFEVKAFIIDDEKNYFFFGFDLITVDGSSINLLLKEVLEYYRDPNLVKKDLKFSFYDYIQGCKEIKNSRIYEQDKEYWSKKANSFPEAPKIPQATSIINVKKPHFKRLIKTYSLDFWEKLKKVSRQHRVTPSIILCSLYSQILGKWANQSELAINATVFNRYPFNDDVVNIIGDFTSLLLIDVDLKSSQSFWDRTRKLQDTFLSALEHRHYSAIEFMKDLLSFSDEKDDIIMPFVFTSMLFDDLYKSDIDKGIVDIKYSLSQTPQVFLDFQVLENNMGLSLSWDYVSELFDEEMINDMFNLLISSMEALVSEEKFLEEIPKKDADFIEKYNESSENIKTELLQEMIKKACVIESQKIAVKHNDRSITYEEMWIKSNKIARYLKEKGYGQGDYILVMASREIESIVNIIGVLKAGCTYIPVDPSWPKERIDYVLENSNAKVILPSDLYESENISKFDKEDIESINEIEDPAYVIYTSGSTGKPKGVVISHRAVSNTIKDINNKFSVGTNDKILALSSMCFDLSVYDIFGALTSGAELVLINDLLDVKNIVYTIRKEGITICNSVPAVMEIITDGVKNSISNSKYWMSNRNVKIRVNLNDTLRLVLLSGDWIKTYLPDFIKMKFKTVEVVSLGGATEASIWSIYYPIKKVEEDWTSIPYGFPLGNQKFYVLDYKGEKCPVGVKGELYIGGAGVALGYINDREKTEKAFIYHKKLGRIYKTGDYGILKKEGYIEFIGRLDNQIKVNGHRIELGEIENSLLKFKNINNAVVVANSSEDGTKQLCAYIVQNNYEDDEKIIEELGKILPYYMVPRLYIRLKKMPLTYNGKIDRKNLPKINNEKVAMVNVSKAYKTFTDVEQKLFSIWKEVLKCDSITLDMDFFSLGGDSLKGINLVNRINNEFNIDIPYRELFRKTTIREISKYIESLDVKTDNLIEKIEKREYYDVSSAQKRMYVLNQLEMNSLIYNTTGVIEFNGDVDVKALEGALNKLIERHEVFRTSFEMRGNKVIQKVKDKVEVKIDIEELWENKGILKEFIDEKIRKFVKPFDLSHAPILRVKMFRADKSRCFVVFDTHHIISDALSQEIIIRDIIGLYNGRELEKLSIQYKDYAKWQNDYLNSKKMKEQEQYWCNVYKTNIPPLDLNTDFPRGNIQSHKGDLLSVNLNKDIFQKIEKLKNQTGSTLYMVLLSALDILLKKYSGQADIAVGSPVAGRTKYELRNLAGVFVNTIAVRNEVDDKLTGIEFLNSVKENVLKAFENEDYPFEKLVEVLKIERDVSRNPVFDIFFALQNIEQSIVSSESLKIKRYRFNNKIAKFDISIYAYEENNSLRFDFEYCTDLFKKGTIERMAESFIDIIDDLVSNPYKKIKDISILTKEDKNKLLYEFNNTTVEYDKNRCVHELFEESVKKHKNKIALICNSKSMTYNELNKKSNALAVLLKKEGVKQGHIVGILINRSFEMIIAILAVLKSGAGYLPIDPDFPEERIKYVIEDSGTKTILSSNEYKDKINQNVKYIDLYNEKAYFECRDNLKSVNTASDTAYVIYTSGSTGKPKAVVLEHRSVSNFINVIPKIIEFNEDSRILNITTMSFDIFILETLLPLVRGLTVVIGLEKDQKDPYCLRKLVKDEKVDMIQMTPSMFSMQINEEIMSYYGNVKTLMLGGETLPLELYNKIRNKGGWKIYNMYGPTETTVWSAVKELGEDDITIGRPIGNTEIYILDSHKSLCPIGIAGELCIGGDGLARGYLNKPELTKKKFIDNPYKENKKIYCTGDLAKINEKGEIVFVSRIDNQVKVRGHRIELSEIEVKLQDIEGVLGAVTAIKENSFGEKHICAYVVVESDQIIKRLKEKLMESLPQYMIPSYFVRLDKIPLTPNGKIDRKSLPDPSNNVFRTTECIKARSEIDEKLIEIWRRVLDVSEVGIDDNFFEQGGTSLGIVRIAKEIKENFNMDITAAVLFQYPSIRKLSDYINGSKVEVEHFVKRSNSSSKDIAVIGMALKVPKAKNLFEFWNNLKEGKECITFFDDKKLQAKGIRRDLLSNKRYVKAAPILENIDYFDAEFFGYNEMDAKVMDPQIRLFEECAWQALEDSGYVPEKYKGRIGLFAGASANIKWQINALKQKKSCMAELFNKMHLSDREFLTAQTSYKLNLKGPSVYINTACSTGLSALHLACQSVRNGECSIALAGAVNASEFKKNGYLYEEGMILSKDGHCRAFDAESTGTIFGDGLGVVVIKALDEAVRDKDNIYAVIKGIAVNNDGNQRAGFTAPGIEGQKNVIKDALYDSGINRETIGYVETHGTGTKLGDPIEIEALQQAYASNKKGYCAIGSVKTNIGHLDVAAGITGFIKTVLSLRYREIPASLNFKTPNPNINFVDSPFYVNTQLKEWKSIGDAPLRAGVSSFGIGGTNTHVILEEAPKIERNLVSRRYNIINLSARSVKALEDTGRNLADFLENNKDVNINDVAFTLAVGRQDFKYRNAIVTKDIQECIEKLRKSNFSQKCSEVQSLRSNIVFMFTGQGSQYPEMGKILYENFDVFRNEANKCFKIAEKEIDYDLKKIMFQSDSPKLDETETAQIVIFIFEYALAKLWNSLGIKQDVMIGHSLGEYVAATLAEVFSIEDAIKLIIVRGKLMQSVKKGSMLSVMAYEDTYKQVVDEKIEIAAINSSSLCVLAGENEHIISAKEKLRQKGCRVFSVNTSHAFHSTMMKEAAEKFGKYLRSVKMNTPKIPYISNLTGDYINEEQVLNPEYYVSHMLHTVQFNKGISKLLKNKNSVFLEVGYAKTLAAFVCNNSEYRNNCVQGGISKNNEKNYEKYICKVLSALWKNGAAVNWGKYYDSQDVGRISLPGYAFQRKKYTIEVSSKINCFQGVHEEYSSPSYADNVNVNKNEVACTISNNLSLEEKVTGIVEDVLGGNSIGIEDNLMELGADSLRLIMIFNNIVKELNVEIPLNIMFKGASIKTIVGYIKNNNTKVKIQKISKVDKKEYYELSPAQKWMYILEKKNEKSVAYNLPFVYRIDGNLDINKLECVIKKIIDRHDAFRTYFDNKDGEIVQRILPNIDFNLNYIEDNDDINDVISKFIRPFDLKKAPLFRIEIVKNRDAEYLLTDMHHIISDGTSRFILFNEIIKLYKGMDLKPLDFQYRDYVTWKNSGQNAEKYSKDKKYWISKFTEETSIVNLPYSNNRLEKRDSISNSFIFEFGEEITSGIRSLAKKTETTINMLLLSSFYILLSKYSGQEDINIGIPISGRDTAQAENIIGVFINTIILRCRPEGKKYYLDFLKEVKKECIESYEHQNYHIQDLVQDLNISENILFNVMFNMVDSKVYDVIEIDKVLLKPIEIKKKIAQFDLTLNAVENKSSISFILDYDMKLFSSKTIKRIADSYLEIFKEILEYHDKKIEDINFINKSEKDKLLYKLNNTAINYSKEKCIHELFEESVLKNKNKTALRFNNKSMSYDELNMRSNKLAWILREKGAMPDSIIVILIDRSFEMIISILAVLKSGAGYLPMDPHFPKERIKHVIEDSGVNIILSCDKYRYKVGKEIEYIDVYNENLYSDKCCNLPNVNKSCDIAYVIYTSGSTGKPKGVVLEHKSVNNFIAAITNLIEFRKEYNILNVTTMSFDIFVLETLLPLVRGLTVVIASEENQKNPFTLHSLIKNENVNMIQMTPSMFNMNINDEMADYYSSVKTIMLGGEVLSPNLLDKVLKIKNCNIYNMYGPTETTVWSCIKKLNNSEITIGRPIGNTKVYILDRNRNICPIGVAGELSIGGDGLARGYLNRRELTNEKFIQNPYQEKEKIYCTGDLAKINDNGEIVFIGRIDNQVKIRGHRIELGEIENELQKIEGILEAAVVVREDNNNEKYICGYVITKDDNLLRSLRSRLKESLPSYMIPSYFVNLEKMPLTPNGKINRKVLPDPVDRLEVNISHSKVENDMQKMLLNVWRQVLDEENIGIDDDFFDLGGHSIKAIRLINILNNYGYKIQYKTVMDHSTIREMALFLESVCDKKESSEDTVKKAEKILKDKFNLTAELRKFKVLQRDITILYCNEEKSSINEEEILNSISEICTSTCAPDYIVYGRNISENYSQYISNEDLNNLVNLKDEYTEETIDNVLKKISNQEKEFVEEIVDKKTIYEYPCTPIQKQYLKYKGHPTGTIIPINMMVNKEKINKVIVRIIRENSLLRSNICRDHSRLYIREFEATDNLNIPYIDLSQYSERVRKDLIRRIIKDKYFKNYLKINGNTVYYRFILIKENLKNYKLIAAINHIIYDGMSSEILTEKVYDYLHSYNLKTDPNRKDYKDYVKKILEGPDITEEQLIEKLKLDEYSKYNKILRQTSLKMIEKTKEVKFKISLEEINKMSLDVWESSFYIALLLCSHTFKMNKIPLKLMSYGRDLDDMKFYDVIGYFSDFIPMLITINEEKITECVKEVRDILEFVREHNVNFVNILDNENLREKWKKAVNFCHATGVEEKDIMILYNFQGKRPEYNEIKDYYDLLENSYKKFRLEGSCYGIFSYYTDKYLFINLLSKYDIDTENLKMLVKEKLNKLK